jgi:hypothetical protein
MRGFDGCRRGARKLRIGVGVLLCCIVAVVVQAGEKTFSSGPQRVSLLELYTSEGCSSCPPAEAWLGHLLESPQLWDKVVPLAFHVDYWDGLGWPDSLASPTHTQRQRAYSRQWGKAGSVYTPAFVLNGDEWRGFFGREELPLPQDTGGGLLRAVVAGDSVRVNFEAQQAAQYQVHLALLGMGIATQVKAGENQGRRLGHEFVVVGQTAARLQQVGDSYLYRGKMPEAAVAADRARALAVWVTRAGELESLQAVGGLLGQ